jgi:hypothetical protein
MTSVTEDVLQIQSLPTTNETGVTLIHDVEELKRFDKLCQNILSRSSTLMPSLLINLSVRTKYMSDTKAKAMNGFFVRKILTLNKDLSRLIRNLEIKTPYQFDDREIENSALSVYICMNPRDQVRGLHDLYKHTMDAIITKSELPKAMDSEFYSTLHQSQQERQFVEIDIDTTDMSIIQRFINKCPEVLTNVDFIIRTRSGFHFVYRKDLFPLNVYQITRLEEFKYNENSRDGKSIPKHYMDVRSDVTFPVPGTFQGGFPVRIVNREIFQQINSTKVVPDTI